jgi:hypothetical protein
MHHNTIVTSCNSAYFWGAYLLIASIKFNHGKDPIHVLASGLSTNQIQHLAQFENVKIIETSNLSPHLEKPKAIMSATTEYITWVDADCLFMGHLDKLLLPLNQSFQIRFRESLENGYVFKRHYQYDDRLGDIPKRIMNIWQNDVNERHQPRYTTQCVSNFLSMHCSHMPFIARWEAQLKKVNIKSTHPIDRHSKAYFMTDESVLSSLFTYASDTPRVSEYQLNKDPNNFLMHFGQSGKPWYRWREAHLGYYNYIIKLLDWLNRECYIVPTPPRSLDINYKTSTFLVSKAYQKYLNLRSWASNVVNQQPLN